MKPKYQYKTFFEGYNSDSKLIDVINDKDVIAQNAAILDRILVEYLLGNCHIYNALHRAGIFTISDLLNKTICDIERIRWLGSKGLQAIEERLKSNTIANICKSISNQPSAFYECIISFAQKECEGMDRDQIVRTLIREYQKRISYERRLVNDTRKQYCRA